MGHTVHTLSCHQVALDHCKTNLSYCHANDFCKIIIVIVFISEAVVLIIVQLTIQEMIQRKEYISPTVVSNIKQNISII